MVDFNNESTVATPPGEVVKIVVLERREQVIEALESYHHMEGAGQSLEHKRDILRARVMALWYEVQAMVKRKTKAAKGTEEDPTYSMVQEAITAAKTEEKLLDAFCWLNEFVDWLGLTVIDSRARYDRTNIEDANIKKGM